MELRKSVLGKQKNWTKEEIILGISEFIKLHNRFPKSIEMDRFENLPTARSVQRTFGGLLQLKKELGILDMYHSGDFRSKTAARIGQRALKQENEIGSFLEERFGEVCVHRQGSASRDNKERLDFIVFFRGGKFGVDTFYVEDEYSLKANYVSKAKKYKDFPYDLYFVQMNQSIPETSLARVAASYGDRESVHAVMVGEIVFKKTVAAYKPLSLI